MIQNIFDQQHNVIKGYLGFKGALEKSNEEKESLDELKESLEARSSRVKQLLQGVSSVENSVSPIMEALLSLSFKVS